MNTKMKRRLEDLEGPLFRARASLYEQVHKAALSEMTSADLEVLLQFISRHVPESESTPEERAAMARYAECLERAAARIAGRP
jgi:hypothetical protein